jgi:hypothetical protein
MKENNNLIYYFYIIAREHPSSLIWYRFHFINENEEENEFEEIED